MKCRQCNNPETRVISTRVQDDDITRRRRDCPACGFRFNSYELTPEAASWVRSGLARWRASRTSDSTLRKRRATVVKEDALKRLRQGWTIAQVVKHFRVADLTVRKWSKAYRASEVQPEREAFKADVLAGLSAAELIEKYGYASRTVHSRKHQILKASRCHNDVSQPPRGDDDER